MSTFCGCDRGDEARYGLETSFAAESVGASGKLAGIIQDVVLIALAWAIFIGVILYPVMQIIGILACSISLLVDSRQSSANTSAEI